MPAPRDILHLDMDAFFASVEQVLDPDLKGKAVVVGGAAANRGVVSSASYEARRYGVRSAMPMAQAKRLCPHAVFVRGSFGEYAKYSDRVRRVLDRFTPLAQAVSLDDFYLDLTGCRRLHGPPIEAAEKIRKAVLAETQLSCSIAVAANRLVAKVGSDFAKPAGIMEVWRGYEAAFLRPLPVRRLPGIGPKTAEELEKFNLLTIGAVAELPKEMLERAFGSAGVALWERANGMDDSPVAPDSGPPRSISREHTFSRDVERRDEVRAMLFSLIERAALQLREDGLDARRVTVKVRFADFQTVTAAKTLDAPDDRDDLFYRAALPLLDRLLARRMRVRLVGVALASLTPAAGRQMDLFAGADPDRRRRFYRSLDRLRLKHGFAIARLGPGVMEEE